MSPARLCVITVVLNAAAELERTIESVLRQKALRPVDYLIVDGGSTDGTLEVIQKYAEHLSWWVSEPDRGIYDAMNKGWGAAPDDSLILFLGAGDRIVSLPEGVERYRPEEVVYGTVRMGEETFFRSRSDFHLRLYNSLHHQALLVNKSLHPAAPFDCSYRLYADFDFNQRLQKKGAVFVHAPEFVAYARPGGCSDTPDFLESLSVIRKNHGWFWSLLAVTGYLAMRAVPLLKRLRPFRSIKGR